ncbi:MAG TPA: colicin E5-related ribonuclease [Pyrinomonadaceae bacterium]|nr:colicin E5-related ribonuclease [Pyrinomonadaceae bacterium]
MRVKRLSFVATGIVCGALSFPCAASADNCGGTIDCHGNIWAAVLAMLAIALFIILLPYLPAILLTLARVLTAVGLYEAGTGVSVRGQPLTKWERILGITPFGKARWAGAAFKVGSTSTKLGSMVFRAGNLRVTAGTKIIRKMRGRGWTTESIAETIKKPYRKVSVRDTRHRADGGRNNAPATKYENADGSYVTVNDKTGDIVQISKRGDPHWK